MTTPATPPHLPAAAIEAARRAFPAAAPHALKAALEAAAPLIAAAERERIRQLAIRNGATCTSDEGTGCYFADLIEAQP